MSNDPLKLWTDGLTKPLKNVLRIQIIDNDTPGPLLTNIQTLIEAIGPGLATTSKYFCLPQSRLDELNQLLVTPREHQIKRPQLRSFPNLMGLFMLLRASDLAVGEKKPRRVVMIDPAVLDQWRLLNPTEQYMCLLSAWLTTAAWESVGEKARRAEGMYLEIQNLYFALTDSTTYLRDDRYCKFSSLNQEVTLSLLHDFGWLRLTYDSTAKDGKFASLRSVERLPFGDAMFAAICEADLHPRSDGASFHAKLQEYFPEWRNSLCPPQHEFCAGQYTLKLSLGDVWRRLVAPAETDLEDVAQMLLDAFDFDNDHLYQFEYVDSHFRKREVVGPDLEGEFFTEDVRLRDLPLGVGDTLTFVFDLGENWQFTIKIEAIDRTAATSEASITERVGQAPAQYDNMDEFDDDE